MKLNIKSFFLGEFWCGCRNIWLYFDRLRRFKIWFWCCKWLGNRSVCLFFIKFFFWCVRGLLLYWFVNFCCGRFFSCCWKNVYYFRRLVVSLLIYSMCFKYGWWFWCVVYVVRWVISISNFCWKNCLFFERLLWIIRVFIVWVLDWIRL